MVRDLDPSLNLIATDGPGGAGPTGIGFVATWVTLEPEWTNPLHDLILNATATYIGPSLDDWVIYRFEADLPAELALTDGWMSVQINADAGSGVWYLWQASLTGDGLSHQRDGTSRASFVPRSTDIGRDELVYDMAFELWYDNYDPLNAAVLVSPYPSGATDVPITTTLDWTSGGGVVEGYRISYGTVNPYTEIVTNYQNSLATSYDPTPDLAYATEYWWSVTPWNSAEDGPSSTWTFTTVSGSTAPDPPQNVVITQAGGMVSITWDAVANAGQYMVYSAPEPDGGYEEDRSGTFYGTSWTAPATGSRRFYYVTAISLNVPANFLLIPGGTFTMGNTLGGGSADELPLHSVTLSPYYIGKYEVTQSEWQTVMGSNPAHGYGVGDNYPVYYVSWYATLKYCNLRSLEDDLTPVYSINGSTDPADWGAVPLANNANWNAAVCNWNANGYRLPTEAEWEYAARGAVDPPDYLYSGSNDINDVGWYYGNSPNGSKPVGTKAPNELGSYDMSGNVYEWCWDCYASDYYIFSPQNNPAGPASALYRVSRGGGWGNSATICRVSDRDYDYPFSGGPGYCGVRICRSVN